MLEKDIADNKAIGANGAKAILEHVAEASGAGASPVRVLTHCNTGSLATAGYGTALGVVRHLSELGKLGKVYATYQTNININTHPSLSLYICTEHVYCTETRPYNQGARLTAYELVHEKLPATLVLDSMVAALFRVKNVAAVVVGADRVSSIIIN